MRYAVAFGRFWYDFLVGDRPVLFLGPVLALVLCAALVGVGWEPIAGVGLVGLVVASAAWALVSDLSGIRSNHRSQ
jgi:hypothetical protein